MKMNRLILFLSLAVGCGHAQAPPPPPLAVSNIHFDGIGDSSVRLLFDVTGTFNAFRVRYGTANTASGSGGFIQNNGTSSCCYANFDMAGNLSGLAPNTLYYVSPEVSNNNGTSWTSGVSATFTTLPRTQTAPIPPTPVSTNFPAQTGVVRNVAADCSNLQSQMNAAQGGDTIVVPAGTVCAGNYSMPNGPGLKTFVPANVRTSDSTVTVANHGFTENQEIRLSASSPNANCLPGMLLFAYGLNCDYGGDGWRKGGRYWAHVSDANHVQILDGPSGNPVIPGWVTFTCQAETDTITFKPTFQTPNGISYLGSNSIPAKTPVQFHTTATPCGGLALNTTYYLLTACPASSHTACVTQVSTSATGSPADITSAGTGTQRIVDQGVGSMYIGPAPDPNGPWIVLTSGGQLPPPGVRMAPGFDSQGFHLRQATPLLTGLVLSGGVLSHNWRIVGAIFDTATNTDHLTSVDPRPYCSMFYINQDNENIIFDRTRLQGAGYPNRFGCPTAILLNGRNIGLLNSDWRGMDHWHTWATGFSGTFAPSTVTLSAGTANAGAAIFNKKTTGNTVITITNGGGASGTGFVYFGRDGDLKVLPPAGVSLTCTTVGVTCAALPGVANPNWPVDARGRSAALKLATFTLAGGVVTSVCAAGCTDSFTATNAGEGAQSIIAGTGPGPYLFDNNFISGTGIPLHFDDFSGPFQKRGDYTLTRNTFDTPASQMATGPLSDGLRYGHRQPLEWKGGQRIKIDGNVFQGSFSESTPACLAVAITPRSGGYVTDVDFTNNTVIGCGGLNVPAPIDSLHPVSKPSQRSRIANNLFLLNGPAYAVQGIGSPRAWALQGGYGSENVLIDHNTVFDPRGTTPAFIYWLQQPVSGMKVTSNIFFQTGNLPSVQGENVSPGCGAASGKALMDCAFTNGPGNPAYTFSNNVIVPSWADSVTGTGAISPSVVTNAFPSSLKNSVPNANSVAGNLGIIKFSTANVAGTYKGLDLRLAAQSPYNRTAADGTQAGANLEQLRQAQGVILQLRPLLVATTTATIAAYVPDAGEKCYVGYGTSENAGTWTWTAADTTNNRERNIALSGLTPQTRYFYSMNCNRAPMPSIEMFRTE